MSTTSLISAVPPPAMDLRLWIEIIDSVNSIIGILLNTLLLYLIIWRTDFRMYEYRPILIQNCLVDVFYTFTEFVVKPQIDYKNGCFYVMCSGFFTNISTPWNSVLMHLWIFALFYCLTSISVQYIYRYFIIVREKKLTILQYFGILAIPTILAIIYTLTDSVVFAFKSESREFHTKQLQSDSYYFNGIPNFIVADIQFRALQLQFAFAFILVNISYVIIFYTNLKIYKKLLTMKNKISKNNFQFQRQLTITLLTQTIVPSIMCMIPIAFSVIMAVSKANSPGVAQIVTLLLSCIPIANPLTTIIVIRQYRKICTQFFKTYLFPNSVISVAHIQSGSNQLQILP